MEKMRNCNLLKRMLIIVLCIALGVGMFPGNNYSVKVEAAATIPDYRMYITTSDGGQHKLTTDSTYSYTGLNETTDLKIMSAPDPTTGVEGLIPVAGDVNGADLVSLEWSVDSDGKIIKVEKADSSKASATIRRVGPGAARITCNISWKKSDGTVLLSKDVTSTIKIPADINKTRNDDDRQRAHFTKLNDGNDEGNTVLMFNIDQNDIGNNNKGKKVVLSYNTKSTLASVNWKTDNSSIAVIERETVGDDENIMIIPKKAGTTTITASSAISNNIKDSFYAVVMPTFDISNDPQKSEEVKIWPKENSDSPILSDLNTVNVNSGTHIKTNALKTSDLKWIVKLFSDQSNETKLLKIDTTDSSDAYIGDNPKAGIYKITAQTVVPNKTIKDDLGVATMYAKVPIEFPNGTDVVLGLGDSFDIMDNSNIQSPDDVEFEIIDPNPNDTVDENGMLEIKGGTITGKNTGLVKVKMRFSTDDIAKKYGILPNTPEHKKYVEDGVEFNFSVVDSFGINNSNIILAIKGTADLTVSTQSSSGITWKSSDDTIVEITNTQGKTATITGNKVGKAVITVTQEIKGVKKSAICNVTVVKSAEKITIDPPSVEMDVDDTKMLKAILSPDNMLVGNLKWSSSDEKVVKIDSYNGQNATIKGVGDGTATVTVINTDNAIIGTCKVTVHGKSSGITVTPATATVQLADKSLQLKAVVLPATNIQPELTWMSSDTSIADVDGNGLVTFKDGGTVKITVFIKSNPTVSATATITIKRSLSGFKLDQTSKVMFTGEEYKLGYTFTPADASNQKINWTSAKPSVASVDSNGNILAVSPGETIIMAQTEDGRYTDYCIVTVKQEAKNIKITTKDVFVDKGEKYKIEYTTDPETATDVSVKWETMDPKIATVDQKGEVTAVEVGSTTILAKLAGEVAYCNVTVIEKADGIKLNYSEKVIYKNNTFALKASIEPEGATNRKVTFVSSKPSVATVTGSGTVKGISPGTALITVTSDDGGHKAICVVIVKEMTTSITLNHTFYALGLHDTFTLVPKVTSNNATDKKVSFTSSNLAIAAVNSKGQVTGKKLGYANIMVRALDGSGVKATCRVRVVVPTKSIKLNRTVMTMIVGRTTKLKPAFSPKNTSYKTAQWTSSNTDIVKVLEDGTVIALSPGTAVITAASKDSGGKKKAVCYVTVREAVPSNGITVTSKNPVMVVGEKFTMSAVLTPYNSTDSVTWESDNTAIASVGRTTGTITAKTSGVASITAISSGGKVSTTTATVVGLDINNITLEQYTNFTISVIGAPAGVFWQSENPSIATVQNGKIITRSAGSTRIVANVRGRRLYCNVRVVPIR